MSNKDISKIAAAGERRAQTFAHLDDAKLGWFHMRATLVAGVGFFTDAAQIWGKSRAGGINFSTSNYWKHIDALVKASTSWGNLIGQLGFGYLGDKLGRKQMYGIELIIMIVCTIGSAFASSTLKGIDILAVLGIWRFFLGIGIGGDYPMSAIITSEFANVRYRGMMMAAVFAMQGVGILVGGIVAIATLAAFETAIRSDILYLDYVWRIMLGFGVIPALCAVYFRMTIPETPRYTVDVLGDEEAAERDVSKVLEMNSTANITSSWVPTKDATQAVEVIAVKENSFADFKAHFGQWKNFKVLFGCAYCWFALDIAWYGLTINQNVILTAINYSGSNTKVPYEQFFQKAIGAVLINLMGTVPGYWVTVATIEKLGRKPIQYLGFGVITVCLIILAAGWQYMLANTTVFVVIYTIAQFFFNFGPNSTTFIVPGEVFPTRWRSTGHGISAATGKLGAIIGVQAVTPFFSQAPQAVLYTFAVVMATGFAATYLVPETKGKTLEELSNEDDVFVSA
ncbi:phosphate:H+ symporter [Batrachochytrium salamandrivorans]|nr:phosphate:H+ symporter [Batrachochytrium salamandrivorans]